MEDGLAQQQGLTSLPASGRAVASSSAGAVFWLLVACAFWGASFNWNKEGQARLGELIAVEMGTHRALWLGPMVLLGVRFALASVAWMAVQWRSVRRMNGRTLSGGGITGALFAAALGCQHFGLQTQSEAVVAVCASLVIVLTPVLAMTIWGEKPAPRLWWAVAVAVAGSIVLSSGPQVRASWFGLAMAILSAVLLAGHVLAVDRLGRRCDWSSFTLVQFVVVAMAFLFVSAVVAATANGSVLEAIRSLALACVDPVVLGYLVALVLAASVVAYGLMFRYQPRIGASRAVVIYATEPLFAAAFAAAASGRRVTPFVLIGGLLILAAVVFAGGGMRSPRLK